MGVLGGAMNGHAVDQLYRPLLLELLRSRRIVISDTPAPPPVRESDYARLGEFESWEILSIRVHLFETHMVQSHT